MCSFLTPPQRENTPKSSSTTVQTVRRSVVGNIGATDGEGGRKDKVCGQSVENRIGSAGKAPVEGEVVKPGPGSKQSVGNSSGAGGGASAGKAAEEGVVKPGPGLKGKKWTAYTRQQWLWMRDRIVSERCLPYSAHP